MTTYIEQLHITYQKCISAFLKRYSPTDYNRLANDIDSYYRTCALCLWATFEKTANECYQAINQIYTLESNKKIYTIPQVEAALAHIIKQDNVIPVVPEFFIDIVKSDINSGTVYSRFFAEGTQILLSMFALEDDEVTFEEARIISSYYQVLIDECNKYRVKPFEQNDPYSFVTKNNNVAQGRRITKDNEKKTTSKPSEKKRPDISIDKALDELESLIGLTTVKEDVRNLVNFVKMKKMREQRGLPAPPMSFHLVFSGNPGTGKTTVARTIAKIYKALGILSGGQVIEVDRSSLVAGYVGQTAIKTQEVLQSALGGILFIDEAYTLSAKEGNDYGQEAIDTILKFMEDNREDIIVIVAGYTNLMQKFINSNPGLKSRFNKFLQFDDYNGDEMMRIFELLCKQNKYTIDDEARAALQVYFITLYSNRGEHFGNARDVRNIFEKAIAEQSNRTANNPNLSEEEFITINISDLEKILQEDEKSSPEICVEEAINELEQLEGLKRVKEDVKKLVNFVKMSNMRSERGLPTTPMSLHLVFSGNPGTGKTTVARIIANIYKALGVLSKGHVVEVDRSGLVAGYVGQTAIKTQEVLQAAMGGILFIDEAYTLSSRDSNDFGKEAIDTILKGMEDNRDDLSVIVAGYGNLMQEFIDTNPGLKSRFNKYISFDDYDNDELFNIFLIFCDKSKYKVSDDAKVKLKEYFKELYVNRDDNFGNARDVRNLFEKIITEHSDRTVLSRNLSEDDLVTIELVDVEKTISIT